MNIPIEMMKDPEQQVIEQFLVFSDICGDDPIWEPFETEQLAKDWLVEHGFEEDKDIKIVCVKQERKV